jgi:hypothetical protein
MSYVISRDNPVLAEIDDATWDRLDKLVEEADESSYPGQHQDACGCTDPKCLILDRILIGNGASSLEVLAFAFARGMLRLDTVAHDTLVQSVSEIIQRDEAGDLSYGQTARRIVDLLRPDLTPTGSAS